MVLPNPAEPGALRAPQRLLTFRRFWGVDQATQFLHPVFPTKHKQTDHEMLKAQGSSSPTAPPFVGLTVNASKDSSS